jgi:hypothetical protein
MVAEHHLVIDADENDRGNEKVQSISSALLSQTRQGDTLQLLYHTGGGGGHQLHVNKVWFRLDFACPTINP